MAETQKNPPILEVAWTRFAQMDAASRKHARPHYEWRRWISILGVLATIFAVLTQLLDTGEPTLLTVILKWLLVLTPILGSVLAAFVNKFYGSGQWLISRAGAEEILKEIYVYRTILKKEASRREWLEKRLTDIQRQVYRGLGGELIVEKYNGKIPPYHYPEDPDSDPGFSDISGDEYFRYRLQDQLAWHIRKLNQYQKDRVRLQIYILLSGGAGALLAAMGGAFSLWVAVTASLAASFIGWQELRNLDPTIRNYSKVIMELTILYDHWRMLEPEERTESEFFEMVQSTEEILWSQNVEYIKSMQEAMSKSELKEAELVNSVIKKAVQSDADMKQHMRDSIVNYTAETMDKTRGELEKTFDEALGSLAEEASSELVQQELAAMRAAAEQAVQTVFGRLSDTLDQIAKEYANVDINSETPKEVLNGMIAKYPTTGEIKG